MNTFITLTLTDSQRLRINVTHIIFYRERIKDSNDSLVQLSSQSIVVKESPEEIDKLIGK